MILELEDGKYTYLEGGRQSVLRYGQPWRDVTGDKFIGAMASEIERLRAMVAQTRAEERSRCARLVIENCGDEIIEQAILREILS